MFSDFTDKELPLATFIAFVATYFLTLAIGRLLKRRAGLPLGIFYQLFCFLLAFYAALTVWGLQTSWRGYVGAILVLLSTTIVVAFIDRYLWNTYFEKRRG